MMCRPRQTGTTRSGCVAPRCKRRRDESGGVRPKASKHCKRHTCEHFYFPLSGSPPCEKLKDPSDSVCSYHAKCPMPNCFKAKIQIQIRADEPRFKREKYCDDHECSIEGCHELRSTLGRDQIQYRPYCSEHACYAENCSKRNKKPDNWFCEDHRCGEFGCPRQRVNGLKYCETHSICEWSLCSSDKWAEERYCRMHLLCETDRCDNWKERGLSHCSRHTCHERNCRNSSGDYNYCSEHRCEWEGCGEHRAVGRGRLCAQHTCRRKGCQNSIGSNGNYCPADSCGNPGCGNERVFRNLCQDHYKRKCEKDVEERCYQNGRNLRQELERKEHTIQAQSSLIRENEEKIRKLEREKYNGGRRNGHDDRFRNHRGD